MWGRVPSKHLEAALTTLERNLERDHEFRLKMLRQQQREKQNMHVLLLCGLWAGLAIVVVMLGAAVLVGLNNQPSLAIAFTGPSLIALVTLFVMRNTNKVDAKRIVETERIALKNVERP
jgi:hypothetical protein